MNPTVDLLTRVDMMAAKRPGGAKVLPSYPQLAPTLGLPKAKPLDPVELSTRLAGLIVEADIVGVGLAQAVPGHPGPPVDVKMLEGFINSGSEPLRRLASYYIEKWSKAVGRRSQQMKDLRGVTPKQGPPPPPTLPDREWYRFGIDAEGRRVTLERHNWWREQYGMPKLAYRAELEPSALDWACQLAQGDIIRGMLRGLRHAPVELGENIKYLGRQSHNLADHARPVDDYADEGQFFDRSTKCNKIGKEHQDTGHFTQLIWKATKFVACGYVVVKDNSGLCHQVWVHRYSPEGNRTAGFLENT
jgi:hypothetical protein